jgi:hypothetical protein
MAAQRPEHAHDTDLPATASFQPRPAHTKIGWMQDRRPVVSKRPLHSCVAAKMSPHIRIGPEPVLTAHARSPSAAGSHCLAGERSPLWGIQSINGFPTKGSAIDQPFYGRGAQSIKPLSGRSLEPPSCHLPGVPGLSVLGRSFRDRPVDPPS